MGAAISKPALLTTSLSLAGLNQCGIALAIASAKISP
jgi:hypothetical protein